MSDLFHNRVANKLAELQRFLDVEFQQTIAHSGRSAELTTIRDLDGIIDQSLPAGQLPPQDLKLGRLVNCDSEAIRPLQGNQATATPVGASSMLTVESQNQPTELRRPSEGLPCNSNDVARASRVSVSRVSRVSSFGLAMNGLALATCSKIKKKQITSESVEANQNCLQRFVTSMRFDYISAILVISNAAFIGVQVEFMYANDAPLYLNIIDWAFCICFIAELTLRLYARGLHGFFLIHDPAWNRFDFFIVATSTFDTLFSVLYKDQKSPLGSVSLLRIARIIRITRVLRIIRVMKFFKDMRILIAAVASTLKTAFWALLLLVLSMYMFSIAIGQMVAEHINTMNLEGSSIRSDDMLFHYFGSIGGTIFTLFMTVAGGIDWQDASQPLSRSPTALFVYLFFITFSCFCMMNVVTGIFCQCAIETFEKDKDNVIECQLAEKERFVSTLTDMFTEWDSSGDGHCSKKDFERHLNDKKMQTLLSTLDIETRDAMALYAMMDRDQLGHLNLDDFINGCITLRGGAKAIHMERALVDGKLTMSKLDRIIRRLDEIGVAARTSTNVRDSTAMASRHVPF